MESTATAHCWWVALEGVLHRGILVQLGAEGVVPSVGGIPTGELPVGLRTT